ncbi:MAG: hypothetical protein ACJ76J_26020 [Thermoanaerobaculia bacterium]
MKAEYASQNLSRAAFVAAWQGRRRRLLGLVRTGMRILPQDRLHTQRLDPSRFLVGSGFRLDLLDQLRDPPSVLLWRQVPVLACSRRTCSGPSTTI